MANECSKLRPGLVRFGMVGTVVAALCCFTPVVVILLGAVGLGWLTGYLDYLLLPALAVFAGLTLYALWRHQRAGCRRPYEWAV